MTDKEHFESLWTDFLEGTLDEAGMRELDAILREDDTLGHWALNDYRLHRELSHVLVPEKSGAFVKSTMAALHEQRENFIGCVVDRIRNATRGWRSASAPSPSRIHRGIAVGARYAGVAACAIALTLVAQHLVSDVPSGDTTERPRGDTTERPRYASSPPVATLLFSDGCAWESGKPPLVEGQRLSAGPLRMARGIALVRFDGGAVLLAEGDIDLDLETRGSARLHRGRVVARVEGEATGFTLRTPVGRIVDLGTEFSVKVEPSGATELHVIEGEVEHRNAARPARLFEAGQAVRYSSEKDAPPQAIQARARGFADALSRVRTPAARDPLVYEGFNYPIQTVDESRASGGYGWAAPWRLRRGAEITSGEPDRETGILCVERDFDAPWLPKVRGTMLQAPAAGFCRVREMANPIDLERDRVYYISFLTRSDPSLAPRADPGPHWKGGHGFRVSFRSSSDYWGDRVRIGMARNSRPQLNFGDGVRFSASDPLPEGSLQFWVVKIAARRHGEDEVFLRIYDPDADIDAVEPESWNLVSRGIDSDARLDLLLLTNAGQSVRWFDEIRVGDNWWAAVPIAPPLNTLAKQQEKDTP